MRRPAVQGGRLPIVVFYLFGLAPLTAVAQGYTYGPGATGSAWGSDASSARDPSMMVDPGGRPYRFRDDSAPRADPGYSFRPDSGLGQLPKNWGDESGWASDPLLRQGLIFRPLDKDSSGAKSSEPVLPPAPMPYPYPQAPTHYDPPTSPGFYPYPVDPYSGGWPRY